MLVMKGEISNEILENLLSCDKIWKKHSTNKNILYQRKGIQH